MSDANTAHRPLSWPASSSFGREALSPEFAKGSAYVNGEILPVEKATIPLLDWGFLRSDACQETISVWNGQFFRLEDHLDRFERSTSRLHMKSSPVTRQEISNIVHRLVAVSALDKAYVQIIMTRGFPPIGSRDVRLCANRFQAFCFPYVWIATQEQQQKGLNLHVSSRVRVPSMSVDPMVKHYHWLDFQMGLLEAYEHNTDTVLLVDADGNIAEGPGFNVFAVVEGSLRTPKNGVLDGMTRRTVLELASERGIDITERPVSVEELRGASEVFLTTTAGGIIPVTSVDGRKLGYGLPGEVTRELHAAYWTRRGQGWLGTAVDYSKANLG
ncbi:aminotransferase class IV [Ancylobacter sp.]|uniref:aminotransferase class IV n=1 Tax=Ancylobacter sp. TaxID=1872567 RepID=UPI003C7BE623